MSRVCEITGRGPRKGTQTSHAHNVSKHWVHINLQKVRVLVDGRPMRMRVSTKALKQGLITRPPIKIRQRKVKEVAPRRAVAVAAAVTEEPVAQYFSDASVVSRLFKPKPKVTPEGEETESTETGAPDLTASPEITESFPASPA